MSETQEWSADPNPPAMGVGDRLKAERETRGLSLDDVSQTLKITPRVLEQVEANAWGSLPGWTFARGVVRGYARFLQLDPEPLLRQLESAPLPKPPALDLPASTRAALPVPGQSEGRDRLTAVAGVLAVAAAVMAYFLVPEEWIGNVGNRAASSSTKPLGEPAPTPVPQPAPVVVVPAETGSAAVLGAGAASTTPASPVSPVPAAPVPAMPATAGPMPAMAAVPATAAVAPPVVPASAAPLASGASPSLTLKFAEGSWVEVKDRYGNMVLQENVAAGATRTVTGATPLALALGNADGVSAVFAGRAVDLKPHTRQRVARLTLE